MGAVFLNRLAGIRAVFRQAPLHGQGQHLGHDLDCRIGRLGLMAHRTVQLGQLLSPDGMNRHLSERREGMVVERTVPGFRSGLRALGGDAVLQITFRKVRHGRVGRRRRGNRFLAPPDAVDDTGGLRPRRIGGDLEVTAQGHPLRPSRPPGLDDVVLQVGRVDPEAEAGEGPVPENGILTGDAERVHGSLVDGKFLTSRHVCPQSDFFVPEFRKQGASNRSSIGAYCRADEAG